jgi:hypothetical protein
MKDKLKQFVDEHREEFEIYQPREFLWDGVDDRLPQKRKGLGWQQVAIAASLLLAIGCGTWIFLANRHNTPAPEAAQSQMAKTEAYFTAIVQMKDAELDQYCKPNPELCREFEKDIATLNKEYYQLKNEYAVSADKKTILKAMMTNLQMQVQLISRQLQIMETVKQKKEEVKFI